MKCIGCGCKMEEVAMPLKANVCSRSCWHVAMWRIKKGLRLIK